jgi:hypothetical protein
MASLESLKIIEPATDSESSNSSSDLSDLGPLELELSRLLSPYPEHLMAVSSRPADEPFVLIGMGSCGAVYAQAGKPFVIKLSKTGDHDALWNDYTKHVNIAQCFDTWECYEVSIPACHYFVPPSEKLFFGHHPGLIGAAHETCDFPTSALVTARIPPLPARVRALLIDKYCAAHNKPWARTRTRPANNNNCLVRVYLGSTKGKTAQKPFSLRNFKLHLNHAMELQLDVRTLARGMGSALAIIHWAAETDARGVEFVLGSSSETVSLAMDPDRLAGVAPLSYTGPASRRTEDLFREVQPTKLYVLDFDQVRWMTVDREGVAQAVEAARVNDPYLPRPLQEASEEKEVWAAFVRSYLEGANTILLEESEDVLELPLVFINGLVDAERERAAVAAAGDSEG